MRAVPSRGSVSAADASGGAAGQRVGEHDGAAPSAGAGRPAAVRRRHGLGEPPQHLREDHPGVAARAEQRAAREGRGDRDRIAVDRVADRRLRRGDGRAHRQQQVRARVARRRPGRR